LALPPSLRDGEQIGTFRVQHHLGAGAMGEVYLAVEDITQRRVALKILAARHAGNQRSESRFRREISAMGQLRHVGVPACAGYGEHRGRPWMAMELIPGKGLDDILKAQGRIDESTALWTVIQLVDILAYCHRTVGMIHRDLKPGNVMVVGAEAGFSDTCRLMIIDYGLATHIDFGDWDDYSVGPRGMAEGVTMAGEVVGTPAYMAPEQIRGEAPSFHSDIYSLGCVLYHLLTGELPYQAPSAMAVLAKHLDARIPDPSQVVPVRPATVGVIQRALAKEPARRFRSWEQFTAALTSARYAVQTSTLRIPRPVAAPPPPTTPTPGTTLAALRPPASEPGTSGWRRPASGDGQPPSSGWKRPG
jgi:serine/threonine-protein kinase